jgi:hypothetical protein
MTSISSDCVLSGFASDLGTAQRSVLSRAQIFRWFKAFSEERESIEDEPRSGRPSRTDENVDRIRDLVRSDRRLTVRMIGEELNLTHTTVHQILTNELGMREICAKMVSKNLSSHSNFNKRVFGL